MQTQAPPRQLLVFGDSGVFGWGDRDGGGWCERLRRDWMRSPNSPVVYPMGIRGDGLERVAGRWKGEWSCRGERRRQTPQAILLSVGLNDTAHVGRPDGRPQLSKDAFGFGMRQLLSEIKLHCQVFVMGMTPVDEIAMPFADCLWYSNQDIRSYEVSLAEACQEFDLPFLSIHEPMSSERDWLQWIEPDGLHLNGSGHHWLHSRVSSWSLLLQWAGLTSYSTATPLNAWPRQQNDY